MTAGPVSSVTGLPRHRQHQGSTGGGVGGWPAGPGKGTLSWGRWTATKCGCHHRGQEGSFPVPQQLPLNGFLVFKTAVTLALGNAWACSLVGCRGKRSCGPVGPQGHSCSPTARQSLWMHRLLLREEGRVQTGKEVRVPSSADTSHVLCPAVSYGRW